MRTSTVERGAAVVLVIEGLVIAALAVWEILALASGDTESLSSTLALIVLTVVGALAVVGFGVATWRGASWGRSGGIVTQVLAMAVAAGALTGPQPQPFIALGIAAPALACLALLIASARIASGRLRERA